MSKFRAWLAVGALACAAAHSVLADADPMLAGAGPVLAGADAAAQFATVAHSAQLTLEASTSRDGATLRLLPRVQGEAAHVGGITVSLDGASEPVRAQADGSWFMPLPASRAARGGRLDVYVVHDGIREVLSGMLAPAPGGAAGGGPLRLVHKQLAWWVLNILVVLIGVIALSRRMS